MAATTRYFQFGRRPVHAMAIFAILSMLSLGCSVRKNYKTLSFFFDGVPDPNAPVHRVGRHRRARRRAPNGQPVTMKMYRHKPYAEGKCDACHAADKKHLVTVKAELCVKCHAAGGQAISDDARAGGDRAMPVVPRAARIRFTAAAEDDGAAIVPAMPRSGNCCPRTSNRISRTRRIALIATWATAGSSLRCC